MAKLESMVLGGEMTDATEVGGLKREKQKPCAGRAIGHSKARTKIRELKAH